MFVIQYLNNVKNNIPLLYF